MAAPGAAGASHEAPKGLASLPVPAQGTISAALGRDDPAYHASVENSGLTARNPKHGFDVRFGPGGPELASGKARFGLSLEKLGYGDYLNPVVPAAPKAKQNRIEYSRGPLTEWYANGPLGLQQGFTLDVPPVGRGGGPLTLALRLSGSVQASLDGDTLILASPGGQGVLRYRGLTAFDATGRGLSANLALSGNTLRIRVEDHRARYPVTIDPLFEDAKLTHSDGGGNDNFGRSVAVSGDTVVVGALGAPVGANNQQGSAYVFVKPAAGWSGALTEGAKLTASDVAVDDFFGRSVAVSGDTVVVGAPAHDIGANGNQGSAYVFVKPAAGWSGALTERAKLTAFDGAATDLLGFSVAVSGDTVVVGAGNHDVGANGNQGSAYVFVEPAAGWSGALTERAKLTAFDGAATDLLGVSVTVSGDTVIVGAPNGGDGGSAYVFLKPAAGWSGALTESAKLTASDGTVDDAGLNDVLGVSVAVSGDTVVVGAQGDDVGVNNDQGSAYVFVKPAAGWFGALTERAKFTASDGAADDEFGSSVAVSGDTAVIGAPKDQVTVGFRGSAYVFGTNNLPPPPPFEAEPATPQNPIPCGGSGCRVPVTCNLTEAQCTNEVEVTVRTRPRRNSDGTVTKAARVIRFAAGAANIPPGGTGTVTLKLTKQAKRFVRATKKKRLKAVLGIREIATTVTNTPLTISRTDVTIRLKRRK